MTPTIATDPLAVATAVVAVVDPQLRRSVTDVLARTSTQLLDDAWTSGDIEELAVNIERLRPSVLFLGLPGILGDASVAVARITNLDCAPCVVAVSDRANPETILNAIRAGAVEFMYPPFEPGFDAVLRSVVTAPRFQPAAPAAGKVIGFSSVKGGCGATTLACHSASWLKNTGKQVLLADLDLSGGIACALMQGTAKYTVDDALQNLHRLDLKLWKALVGTTPCGVDVMPAPPDPQPLVPISRKLPPMLRFWRNQYEFTMIDLGHGITPALIDVLNSIDTLVLVATNEIPALRQARQMIHALELRGLGANRMKLVLNRMPKRSPIQLPELEKILGHPIYAVVPNDYRTLSEAYSHPRLIDLDSPLGVQFGSFAAKMAGIQMVEKKRRRLFKLR
jgi:Flp pilus assembly CpaE family ATPase